MKGWKIAAGAIKKSNHLSHNTNKNKNDWCVQGRDQPGHTPILIRVFAVCSKDSQGPKALHADSEDSDQTGHISRLNWVFAGRTGHCVGFDVLWLNFMIVALPGLLEENTLIQLMWFLLHLSFTLTEMIEVTDVLIILETR